jgi:hypothetical protein
LTAFGLKMSLSALKNPEESKKLQADLLQKLNGVEFGSMASAVRFRDEPASAVQVVGVTKAHPIEKFKEFSRASVEAMGDLEFSGFRQTSTLVQDAETYGDLKGDLITVQQEYDDQADPTGVSRKLQDFLFGKDGMQTRAVYFSDSYAATIGGGQAAMKNLLDALKSGKANSVAADRKKLLEKANFLMLMDLPGCIAKMAKAASKVPDFKLPINDQMIDALNLRPSYVGLAIGSDKNFLHNQLRVPASQVIGMTKLVVLIGGVARGGL